MHGYILINKLDLFLTIYINLWLLQSEIHELLALVYYDSLQNVVPFYDQRSVLPSKDGAWVMFCENSMKHFKKAFALKYSPFLSCCLLFAPLYYFMMFYVIQLCADKIGCMHFTWANLVKNLDIHLRPRYHITTKLFL